MMDNPSVVCFDTCWLQPRLLWIGSSCRVVKLRISEALIFDNNGHLMDVW
jgi:hypothetical protein